MSSPSSPAVKDNETVFPICLLKMRDPCGGCCTPVANFSESLPLPRSHLTSPHLHSAVSLKCRGGRERSSEITVSARRVDHYAASINNSKTNTKWLKMLRCAVTCSTILLCLVSFFFFAKHHPSRLDNLFSALPDCK